MIRIVVTALCGLAVGVASTLPWHWRDVDRLAICQHQVEDATATLIEAKRILRQTGDDLRIHGYVLEAAAKQCRRKRHAP
jgi:hypothetical protein